MAKNVWNALKGLAGAPAQAEAGTIVEDLFGRDTAKAAKQLGVSRRTVQRWVQHGLPNTPQAKALQKRHRRWQNESKAGQAKVMGQAAKKAGAAGVNVNFNGKVIISADRRNNQDRRISFAMSADEVELLAAAAQGGRADLHAAFEHIAGGKGFGGSVQLDIKNLDFT